jgi:transcriptional regulator with XRE-family HTH domain
MKQIPGERLRSARESLRLTLREVETMSSRLALQHQEARFTVSFIRLFRIESKGLIPTIHTIYSLALAYRKDCREIMNWYGVNIGTLDKDLRANGIPVTHRLESDLCARLERRMSKTPVGLNATSLLPPKNSAADRFDLLEVGRGEHFIYAYVGTEDYTMYPLIRPGSFLQVAESGSAIAHGSWRSEFEKPIYLVETRNDGLRVGWCSMADSILTIQPHPLSPTIVKSYRHPRDAEIIGQVVAVTMGLVDHDSERLAVCTDVHLRRSPGRRYDNGSSAKNYSL